MKCQPSGPVPADFALVGEAPGAEEERLGRPFVGVSGMEKDRMFAEAGIPPSVVFTTNVARYRPPNNDMKLWMPETKKDITPDMVFHKGRYVKPIVVEGCRELEVELAAVRPKVIIAAGNTALWALTGKWGIKSWRGSMLRENGQWIIPIYHPAAILREWSWRFITLLDLKRARRQFESPVLEPKWSFHVRPSFNQVQLELTAWLALCAERPLVLSLDIETRAQQIACIGIADSITRALCIPLMVVDRTLPTFNSYWAREEEAWTWEHLKLLFEHPNVRLVLQNGSYDCQYFIREMGIIPRLWWDTMMVNHLLFLLQPKDLAYLSSFHLPWHVYWKDEGKEWAPSMPEERLWSYNCMDAVRTYEIYKRQETLIETFGLQRQLDERRASWWAAMYPMVRGVRVDQAKRAQLDKELESRLKYFEDYFKEVLGHPLNPQSNKQMHTLFYDDFKVKPVFNRKTKARTLNDEALDKIGVDNPLFRPLIAAIALQRTTRVIKSTFIDSPLDVDQRARTEYSIDGTDSLRLASGKNVFGNGMNLQNIPSEKSNSVGKAVRRMGWLGETFEFPNIREIYVPDPGMTFFDEDLNRADLHVVVWEAEDEEFKKVLRMGVDTHLYALRDVDGVDLPVDELVETHPNYKEHYARHKLRRAFMRVGCHAANYGARPNTLAAALSVPVKQADHFRKRWFGAHPGILRWQERVERDLMTTRSVKNKFGYSVYYFDRVETLLGEALAWVPQSTVALVTLQGWINLAIYEPLIEVLLQIHDSLAGQFPTSMRSECLAAIERHTRVVVPYDDPLIIPVGVKTSEKSWGDCA